MTNFLVHWRCFPSTASKFNHKKEGHLCVCVCMIMFVFIGVLWPWSLFSWKACFTSRLNGIAFVRNIRDKHKLTRTSCVARRCVHRYVLQLCALLRQKPVALLVYHYVSLFQEVILHVFRFWLSLHELFQKKALFGLLWKNKDIDNQLISETS